MIVFPILGGILVIFGLLLIISPNAFFKIERKADRIYVLDHKILKHRYFFGLLLILSASYLMYVYFTF